MNNIIKGQKGESLAREYLLSKDYSILASNYRNKIGEIDIIALDKDILVFIEVKTRSNINFGYPHEAVNIKKQRKIINCSYIYLQEENYCDRQFRYDIIEILLTPTAKINHIENSFC